jgi:hypothetical protein
MTNMWTAIWVGNSGSYEKILICHFNFLNSPLAARIGKAGHPFQHRLLLI